MHLCLIFDHSQTHRTQPKWTTQIQTKITNNETQFPVKFFLSNWENTRIVFILCFFEYIRSYANHVYMQAENTNKEKNCLKPVFTIFNSMHEFKHPKCIQYAFKCTQMHAQIDHRVYVYVQLYIRSICCLSFWLMQNR